MSQDVFSLDELARHLGRDRREIERLANRGRIPGRKTESGWVFREREITQWLERELREYTDPELKALEDSLRSDELRQEVPVSSLLKADTVQVPLEARTKRSVLESLVEVAGRTWNVWEPAKVLAAVQEREEALSTAFPEGVAIPHPRNPLPQCLGASVVAFGRTMQPVPFGGTGGGMTDLFFLVLCRDSRTHLQVLARLGRMVRHPDLLDALREADNGPAAYELIRDADREIGESL
jgi:PTS system nitrogen regulatory IIA component